jgi:hypothetical protein
VSVTAGEKWFKVFRIQKRKDDNPLEAGSLAAANRLRYRRLSMCAEPGDDKPAKSSNDVSPGCSPDVASWRLPHETENSGGRGHNSSGEPAALCLCFALTVVASSRLMIGGSSPAAHREPRCGCPGAPAHCQRKLRRGDASWHTWRRRRRR